MYSLLTYCTHNRGNFGCNSLRLGTLETKFNCLSRLYYCIPTETDRRVGIISRELRIPRTADAITARVLPFHPPTIQGGNALVGDAHRTGKTRAPFAGQNIFTLRRADSPLNARLNSRVRCSAVTHRQAGFVAPGISKSVGSHYTGCG